MSQVTRFYPLSDGAPGGPRAEHLRTSVRSHRQRSRKSAGERSETARSLPLSGRGNDGVYRRFGGGGLVGRARPTRLQGRDDDGAGACRPSPSRVLRSILHTAPPRPEGGTPRLAGFFLVCQPGRTYTLTPERHFVSSCSVFARIVVDSLEPLEPGSQVR